MKYISVIISLCFITNCLSQSINWKDAKNWKLYSVRDGSAFRYSIDTLKNFESIDLDYDVMQSFLSNVIEWPKDKFSLWMGLYVVTCELPTKEVRKIEISVYGGFFYDEKTKTYFQLPESIKNDWLEYFSINSDNLYHHTNRKKGSF
ncbi:MAG: hypothetical protein ABI208_03560 [Ginsengibacter sp.]